MNDDEPIIKIKRTTTTTYKFSCIRFFNKFNMTIKSHIDKKFYKCFNCKHEFADEEELYIGVAIGKTGNKIFCKKCAEKLNKGVKE